MTWNKRMSDEDMTSELRKAGDALAVSAADRIEALNARVVVLERELGDPEETKAAMAMLEKADRFYFGKNVMGARIWVETRGNGRWCVFNGSAVYSVDGFWEPEGLSSGRTEEFIARTRYSFAEAVKMAEKALVAPRPDY